MWLRRTCIALVAMAAAVVSLTVSVGAQAPPITIAGTAGQGVNVRTGPGTAYPSLGRIPEGAHPAPVCYTHGERIGGGLGVGTTLWWRVNYAGKLGYYSSAYDNVPYSWQSSIEAHYAIFGCNGLPAPPVGRYNRQAAVSWALAHAQDVQPASPAPACTWFASNALWAGGLSKTSSWTPDKGVLPNPPRPATYAPALVQYLRSTIGIAEIVPLGDRFAPGKNAIPEAQLGDLIAYDWEADGTIDHMTVVVHIAPGSYPDVSEWGLGAGMRARHQLRGWTWSGQSEKWLQIDYPRVTAWLVHIK